MNDGTQNIFCFCGDISDIYDRHWSHQMFPANAFPREPNVVPSRAGYTFGGWYTMPNPGVDDEPHDFNLRIRGSGSFFARWFPTPFTDITDGWYAPYVQSVFERGIMQGVSATHFAPGQTLNRAMLATSLWRMEGEPAVTFRSAFSDVPSNAPVWYRNAVIWAHENGIVQGYRGRFDPYGDVTREQFAAMLHRYAQFVGIGTNVPDSFDLDNFQDRSEISAWAEAYMVWAVYQELIQGVGNETLAPDRTATCAEAAALLMRFMERFAE